MIKNTDTAFVKDKTDSLIKTTYIQEETEGITDFRSEMPKDPTISIVPETKKFKNTVFE